MGVGSPNFGVLISNQLPPEENRGEPEKRVAGAMVRLLVSAGNLLKHTRCFFNWSAKICAQICISVHIRRGIKNFFFTFGQKGPA